MGSLKTWAKYILQYFYPNQRSPFTATGFNMVELAVGLALFSVVGLQTYTFQSQATQAHNIQILNHQYQIFLNNLRQTIRNETAWKNTYQDTTNASMDCLRTGSSCLGLTGGYFNLKNASDNLVVNSLDPNAGFDRFFDACTGFDSVSATDCPIQVKLKWRPICDGTTCPQLQVTIEVSVSQSFDAPSYFVSGGTISLTRTAPPSAAPPSPPVPANVWTWISGSEFRSQAAVYGTKGVVASTNTPGSRRFVSFWSTGNEMYMFGGDHIQNDASGNPTKYKKNDLWKFDPGTEQWTWVHGSSATGNSPGNWGVKGVPAPSNVPSGRSDSTFALDEDGNLWMYGGIGVDSANGANDRVLADLWKYDVALGQWIWVAGSHRAQEESDLTYYQGNSVGDTETDTDSTPTGPRGKFAGAGFVNNGYFYIFGGHFAKDGTWYHWAGDMWRIHVDLSAAAVAADPLPRDWEFVGSMESVCGTSPPPAGEPGCPDDPTNPWPGRRFGTFYWTDKSGKMWMFSGEGNAKNQNGFFETAMLDDFWVFDMTDTSGGLYGTWTLKGGQALDAQAPTYGTILTPDASNYPGGREFGSWNGGARSDIFWMAAGWGYGSLAGHKNLDALWRYDNRSAEPTYGMWTWMAGSQGTDPKGNWGVERVPATTNKLSGREGAAMWIDGLESSMAVWSYGGRSWDVDDDYGGMSDLWHFNYTP